MAIVYLSLGSNKGDRIGYVQQATSLLGAVDGINIIRTSAFYETEPWNMVSETWFVNAVVEIKLLYHLTNCLLNVSALKNNLAEKDKKKMPMMTEQLILISCSIIRIL